MPQELDDWQWWRDDAVWFDLFNPALHEDPSKAERAAKLFHCLLVDIENNPQGATRAIDCLENALRLAFSFTRTYRACRILFEVSLGDDFPPNLDSMELLTEAMRRMQSELERASRLRTKKGRSR